MSCPLSVEIHQWVQAHLLDRETLAGITTAGTTFAVIAAAEIGDKSQLVCMTLAARHRHWPVLLGALAAFALLNLIAVIFGSMVAQWIPKLWIAVAVALLFAVFGVMALFSRNPTDDQDVREMTGHGVFITTFLMIFLAEFGDKTQLATAGLSTTAPPFPVWLGATVALAVSSVLGIVAGRTVLQRMPVVWLHRVSGLLFLSLAAYVLWDTLSPDALADGSETLDRFWQRMRSFEGG